MSLLPYGSSDHISLATKFGPAEGKGDSLMPYGSQDNAILVAKVAGGGGKRACSVVRINARDF